MPGQTYQAVRREVHLMRVRHMRMTIRALMVAIFVAAIWFYIIVQAVKYQARHLGICTAPGAILNEVHLMSNKEWFALAVRIFGVWLIVTAVGNVAAFFDGKLYPGSPQARDAAAGNLIYRDVKFWPGGIFPARDPRGRWLDVWCGSSR